MDRIKRWGYHVDGVKPGLSVHSGKGLAQSVEWSGAKCVNQAISAMIIIQRYRSAFFFFLVFYPRVIGYNNH